MSPMHPSRRPILPSSTINPHRGVMAFLMIVVVIAAVAGVVVALSVGHAAAVLSIVLIVTAALYWRFAQPRHANDTAADALTPSVPKPIALVITNASATPPSLAQLPAVFSNATLHWVLDKERAARAIWFALKNGGRFAGEMGGEGGFVGALQRAVVLVEPEDRRLEREPGIEGRAARVRMDESLGPRRMADDVGELGIEEGELRHSAIRPPRIF